MNHRPGGMKVSNPNQKADSKIWGKLINYCKKYLPYMAISLILSICSTIFSIIGPDKLKEITDLITKGLMGSIDLSAISKIALLLASIYILGAVFNYIQGFMMTTITQKVSKNLRTDISKKINKLPLKYFDKITHGEVLSRVTNDVDTIGQTLNSSISSTVSGIVMFFGCLFMMLSLNVIMTLSAVAASVIGIVVTMLIMVRSQKYFNQQQQQLGKINGHIEEVYSGHQVISAYNAQGYSKNNFNSLNTSMYQATWKSQFLSGLMMPIMGFIGNLGYVTVCVVGAILVTNGDITFGVIVAFMTYIRMFSQPLQTIAQAMTSFQSTAAAATRVFDFLDEKEMEQETNKRKQLTDTKGDVSFNHVRFGYDESKMIINDFNAVVKAGMKIAIVGPTGAGKTTIVNLLMRFYELNSGDICIDGISTKEMTRQEVHDQFCMVLQDTWLFNGTIKENIIYSKKGVTDEQVKQACSAAGIHHFIETLPNGYDTILDEKTSLSAGQKQLMTIARAMIQDAPLLILDEATSSVDTRTEIIIQEAMDQLMKGRTSFVIAHRLSTIKNADMILVMNNGDIIESGNHDELINQHGFYSNLYNSQFTKINQE